MEEGFANTLGLWLYWHEGTRRVLLTKAELDWLVAWCDRNEHMIAQMVRHFPKG